MDEYLVKGTLQTCPYSGELAIVVSWSNKTDKSQCSHSNECTIEQCPLEQELKHF